MQTNVHIHKMSFLKERKAELIYALIWSRIQQSHDPFPLCSQGAEFKSKILHSLLSTAYAILDHLGPLTGLSEIKVLRKMKCISQRLFWKRNETIIITLDFLTFLVSQEYVTTLKLIMPTLSVYLLCQDVHKTSKYKRH